MSAKIIEFKKKTRHESGSSPASEPPSEPATFKHFHMLVMSNQLDLAELVLAHLLGIDKPTAHAATRHYARAFASDPRHVEKTMAIRDVMAGGVTNDGTVLMLECFGLDGLHAVCALEHIIKANNIAEGR